jgi:hypothetical protein
VLGVEYPGQIEDERLAEPLPDAPMKRLLSHTRASSSTLPIKRPTVSRPHQTEA